MKTIPVDPDLQKKITAALARCPLFLGLAPEHLGKVLESAALLQFESQEALTEEGEKADSFFVMLKGEASVRVSVGALTETVEVGRLKVSDPVGEMGLLLEQPRTARVVAEGQVLAIKFDGRAFSAMFQK